MIHQYRNNGYNIVMDVYSGSVHVVDDVCYDVIAKLNGSETEPTAGTLKETGVKEIRSVRYRRCIVRRDRADRRRTVICKRYIRMYD